MLAESKGVRREAESEGSCRQNVGPMNKNHIQGEAERTRGQKDLKSKTYTEVLSVHVAVINGEVSAHYPGRSPLLPQSATAIVRWQEGNGEVSRGHSRRIDLAEGPNRVGKIGGPSFR